MQFIRNLISSFHPSSEPFERTSQQHPATGKEKETDLHKEAAQRVLADANIVNSMEAAKNKRKQTNRPKLSGEIALPSQQPAVVREKMLEQFPHLDVEAPSTSSSSTSSSSKGHQVNQTAPVRAIADAETTHPIPPFKPIYQAFGNKGAVDKLRAQVEAYQQKHPENPLKIAFIDNPRLEEGILTMLKNNFNNTTEISIGYSATEFKALARQPELEFLGDDISIKMDKFQRQKGIAVSLLEAAPTLSDLKDKYNQCELIDSKAISIDLPGKKYVYKGKKGETGALLSTMIKRHKHLIVGEHSHNDLAPKEVLTAHMKEFADNGIKTLLLEFCCYDTLQDEMDRWFETKIPSPFVKEFFLSGFGEFGTNNQETAEAYFKMAQAAVDAGIRPVGMEMSNTIGLGYHEGNTPAESGSNGKERMLGVNLGAVDIFNKYKEEGGCIFLAGIAHVSFSNDIAGLSELTGVPNAVIKTGSKPSMQALTVNEEDAKELDNMHMEHFNHLVLDVPQGYPPQA